MNLAASERLEPTGRPDPIAKLFAAQRARLPALAQTGAAERAHKLRGLVTYLQRQLPRFQQALERDLRRAPLDTLAELLMVKAEAEFAIKHLARWMMPRRVKNTTMSRGTKAYVRHEPKGVVAVISPWNAPFACSLVPLVGALAAGNAVLLKPSELSPHSSAVLREMIEALFPRAEVAVVEGDAGVARALLELPLDHVYFTGSPDIGKLVMAAAARHLTPVTLELGGKNPTVVDPSALVEDAARKIVWGKCANAGQACVAPDYVLVHRSVAARFIQAARRAASEMYDPQGRGFAQSPDLCRIISARHFQRVQGLLDDARAKGATVELGGETNAEDRYVSPTILSGVTRDMKVMQEEIFAPILPVMPYDSPDEVVAEIAARDKPLALYVYSRSRRDIDHLVARTSAGSTVINHNMIQAGVNSHLPFGGVKTSGMGRSIGRATFEGFSNARSFVEQPTGWRDFSWLSLPPYSKLYQRMLGWLFH